MQKGNQRFKTPRLYKIAAKIIKEHEGKGTSVKELLFSAKHPNKSAINALVCETLKNRQVLKQVAEKANLFENEPRLDTTIAHLLLHELLFSKKNRLQGESKAVIAILNHEKEIREALNSIDETRPEHVSIVIPRYVRINILKTTSDSVINTLIEEGFQLLEYPENTDNETYLDLVRNLGKWQFVQDIHIPDLLAFHPKQQFYFHNLYLDGYILLQDKASCLPVFVLSPPAGSVVLDACAAPGMKTTHVAAVMGNEGKIYANDMDKKRRETMENMLQVSGVSCCKIFSHDFTKMPPSEFSDVNYIMLDPSCSGSGIVNRIESQPPLENEVIRLKKLANFQAILLKYALSFPSVKKVVYSTCSVHEEENEKVIDEVYTQFKNDFKLVNIFKEWSTRGLDRYKFGHRCLRANPDTNLTNGFFVAMFKRRKSKKVEENKASFEDEPAKKKFKN